MDADTFRAVLGQWPSGVTVVTTRLDDVPFGMTASSFTSVSLDPPLVLVCLAKTARTHDAVLQAGRFAVNILGVDQADVGQRFAGPTDDHAARFDGLDVRSVMTGAPVLADALGWLDCTIAASHDGGDHTVVVGAVAEAGTSTARGPLLYHSRSWGRFHGVFPDHVELVDVSLATGRLTAAHRVHLATRMREAGVSRVHLGALPGAAAVLREVRANSVPLLVTVVDAEEADAARALGADALEVIVPAGSAPALGSFTADRVTVADAFADTERTETTVASAARAGATEIVLQDTSAIAAPQLIRDVLTASRAAAGAAALGVATDDARGLGIVNALTAANQGVRSYDCAVGGLNAARVAGARASAPPTEELAALFVAMGIGCAVDVDAMCGLARELETATGAALPGRRYCVDSPVVSVR